MTRIMYDAVTVGGLPTGGSLYAGYVDGRFANYAQVVARFPSAVHVPIAVFPSTNAGTVLDCETGDATPAQCPGWVTMRRAAGVDPSVYCNAATWPLVQKAFASAGVAQPHYWIAQYDGNPAIPSGAVAKQYQSYANYDISAVADYWPGVDGGDMPLTQADANLVATTLLNWAITTPGKPAGTTGRAIWDVLGDGERIQSALYGDIANLIKSTSTAVIAAMPAPGQQVDVPALATALAGPLSAALQPLLPPGITPGQVVAAMAVQLAKP